MKRTTLQEKGILRAVCIAALIFAFALLTSFALAAGKAEAQSTRVRAQAEEPAFSVPDVRPPLGYGGGPRGPRDPDLTPRLGDLFDRFREFILRLFRG